MPQLQTTQTKRTKKAKLNAAIAAEAMRLAYEKNDKLAEKATRFKHLWMKLKKKIQQKYRSKARSNVMGR